MNSELLHVRDVPNVDRDGAAAKRPVAKLASRIPAPAGDTTARGKRTGMKRASGNSSDAAGETNDVDRCGGGGAVGAVT